MGYTEDRQTEIFAAIARYLSHIADALEKQNDILERRENREALKGEDE